jgi:fatty acid amide hydrolase
MGEKMKLFQLSATQMLQKLNNKEISSEELIQSLIDRKRIVEPKINSIVHHFDEQAIQKARESDKNRASNKNNGALNGLPITIKENIAVKGFPQTLGILDRKKIYAEKDASIVQNIRNEGAIITGKSNVPLLLLSFECDNDIWGPCNNPWDLQRVPGGSSGGEAAAIASGISPLGIGSDIGGSIRIPAAWCGIVGLKPTFGLWSVNGSAGAIKGQEVVRAQIGPMARTTEDIVLLMNALRGQRKFDSSIRDYASIELVKDLKGMRIGYYCDDGFFEPSKTIQRALLEAKEHLAARGATLIPYSPPSSWEIIELYFKALSSDGGETLREAMGAQDVNVQLKTLFRMARLPKTMLRGMASIAKRNGEQRTSLLLRALGKKPVSELWKITAERTKLQRQEMEAWERAGLDVIIGPPTVTVAAMHKQTSDWSMGAYHTMRYNVLDLPAGVVPVSRVIQGEDIPRAVEDRLDKKAAMFEANSLGLPLSVQVIGKPWREDQVLSVMNHIEMAARTSEHFPHTPIDVSS